jgi:hypothetical protein
VLGTDPVSVVTELALTDEYTDALGVPLLVQSRCAGAAELAPVASALGLDEDYTTWDLDAVDAERLTDLLRENSIPRFISNTSGHSSLSAARILLDFNGYCTGCGERVDLTVDNARDQVYVHTVDPSSEDWAAVLCTACRDHVLQGNAGSLTDFKLAQHPECPSCGARRTQLIRYGMPIGPDCWGPWVRVGGCCVTPESRQWNCQECFHRW